MLTSSGRVLILMSGLPFEPVVSAGPLSATCPVTGTYGGLTDGVAARVSLARWASVVPARPWTYRAAVMGRRGKAACGQRAPGLPWCACAATARAVRFQRSRAHRFLVQYFYGPHSESRPDKLAINFRFIYKVLRCGMWTI
jgi:hypothetical protein